jgi:hypothetical protein
LGGDGVLLDCCLDEFVDFEDFFDAFVEEDGPTGGFLTFSCGDDEEDLDDLSKGGDGFRCEGLFFLLELDVDLWLLLEVFGGDFSCATGVSRETMEDGGILLDEGMESNDFNACTLFALFLGN